MHIESHQLGAVVIVRPEGPLTSEEVEQFQNRVEEIRHESLGRFVLDISGVPCLDSQGLEALLDLTEALAEAGTALKLCGSNDTLREILEITELSTLFEYYEDMTTAARSFL